MNPAFGNAKFGCKKKTSRYRMVEVYFDILNRV